MPETIYYTSFSDISSISIAANEWSQFHTLWIQSDLDNGHRNIPRFIIQNGMELVDAASSEIYSATQVVIFLNWTRQ